MDRAFLRPDQPAPSVVYATSEIVPYASSGGLGDVAAALPKALKRRRIPIVRIMPLYRRVAEAAIRLVDTGWRPLIPFGSELLEAEIWYTDAHKPRTYFVRRDEFFDRSELYSLPERDYHDNLERFSFFQKAVVAFIDARGERVDVVHANDWQTGLIPFYLKHGIYGNGRWGREQVVFTIHNLAFQGIFPAAKYAITNLPLSLLSIEQLEYYGQLNCMKGGITGSDLITTVSETYAREIQTERLGCGLHGVLQSRRDRLLGILNGADYAVWDPRLDTLIPENYDARHLEAKVVCKRELLKRMGLAPETAAPLLGMVSRLADQKGFDLLAKAMPKLMSEDLRFVLLGTGQERYQQLALRWAKKWPDRFAVRLGFDQELAHLIEAGADIFLMPSRFEPCGLNQLYSLRYGTLPVVHATGGLEDTIEEVNPSGSRGTGIKFTDYTPAALVAAVQRALQLYRDPPQWHRTLQRAMRQDFSWSRSAGRYAELYRQLADTSRPQKPGNGL